MDDAPPDVRRNQLDLAQPALFDSVQQLIGLAQLIAWSASGAALPGPEALPGNFQNGALDHDLSSHDSPRKECEMEQRIESQPVYRGKLFQVFKDRVRLPDGNTTTREIVRHPGSVDIAPRQKGGRIGL